MGRRWKLVPVAALLAALLELTVFVLLGRVVGFTVVLLLVVVTSLAGMWLLRREGTRAWRSFRMAAQSGRPPGDEVTDGLIGLTAGLLLAAPGLVSAAAGLLLVVPPVRVGARRMARSIAERRMSSAAAGSVFGPRRVRVQRGQPHAQASPPGRPTDGEGRPGPAIEGEIVPPASG